MFPRFDLQLSARSWLRSSHEMTTNQLTFLYSRFYFSSPNFVTNVTKTRPNWWQAIRSISSVNARRSNHRKEHVHWNVWTIQRRLLTLDGEISKLKYDFQNTRDIKLSRFDRRIIHVYHRHKLTHNSSHTIPLLRSCKSYHFLDVNPS